jgi:hypothetical protein
MGKALTLVSGSTETKAEQTGCPWRERPVTEEVIFKGTDDCGRSGWFLRLTASGLYPRRVGPYRTQRQAIEVLEAFTTELALGTLLNLANDMTSQQAYVVEGVPVLAGPCKPR